MSCFHKKKKSVKSKIKKHIFILKKNQNLATKLHPVCYHHKDEHHDI